LLGILSIAFGGFDLVLQTSSGSLTTVVDVIKTSTCYTKGAWRTEEAAMGNSTIPTVLDKLCMVANINTRKLIELKKAEIKIKEAKIQALSELIDSLEQKTIRRAD
jgi:hypothetical protein